MIDERGHIILKIDTEKPIETDHFIGAVHSIKNQYEKYISEHYPNLQEPPKFLISEVRKGSLIVDFLPTIYPLVEHVQHIQIIDDFLCTWQERIKTYLKNGGRDSTAKKSDIKDILDSVEAICENPNTKQELKGITYKNGKEDVHFEMSFSSQEAKKIHTEASEHLKELETKTNTPHEKVAMFFERSCKSDSVLGKRSGEKVTIEDISSDSKPLIYSSELAESKIKHELRNAEDNPYKKAFIVDVVTETRNGKIWGYKVTNLHEIINTDL